MLDSYVFKLLAHNDTGAAKGHQGGIVIPKEISSFFPPLPSVSSSGSPTVEVRLTADLFVGSNRVATVKTRYQHQTWGGKRPPERRLTDQLGPLRNLAVRDDMVLFAKDLLDDGLIQVRLIKQNTAEYGHLLGATSGKRWGVLDKHNPPVTIDDINNARDFVSEMSLEPASAFGKERTPIIGRSMRKARNKAFRERVLSQYSFRCAFTGQRYASPLTANSVGLDAAHIVPVSENGSDHPANGLSLTKDMHWAFDRGLIGVAADRTIYVSEKVSALEGNEGLTQLHKKPIQKTVHAEFEALDEALEWHRSHVLIK